MGFFVSISIESAIKMNYNIRYTIGKLKMDRKISGKYAIPKDILALKPRGKEIKKIGGHYYVYDVKHVKAPNAQGNDVRWRTKSGKCIGKIEPGIGFVPNSGPDEETTVVEFSQYHLPLSVTSGVLDRLKKSFNPMEATEIYLIALMDYVNGYTCIRDFRDTFGQSYLSLVYPGVSMTDEHISELLDGLGRKTGRADGFVQGLIDSSKRIAVDGHVIQSESECNSLTDFGNKYCRLAAPQINLLCAYDIDSNSPVYADIFEGGLVDSKSVGDMLSRFVFNDKLFIVDSGFYSKDNLSRFTENGCHYIIPFRQNFTECREMTSNLEFQGDFIYRTSSKTGTEIKYRVKMSYDHMTVLFRDENENLNDRIAYRSLLEAGTDGYTKEEFEEKKELFGVIVLRTDMTDKTPEEIYRDYKKRWKIETYYNHLKNYQGFRSLHQCSYYVLRGLSFISLIEGMIHSELTRRKNATKLSALSERELLVKLAFAKAKKEGGVWMVCNAKKKVQEIYEAFSVTMPASIDVVPYGKDSGEEKLST